MNYESALDPSAWRRPDLNLAHLAARGGIRKDFQKELVLQANKSGWLPAHLSKNEETARWLCEISVSCGLSHRDLAEKALLNFAESTQTAYGRDLLDFLLEAGFSQTEAEAAAVEPTRRERIALCEFWLSELPDDARLEFVDVALRNSNSYALSAMLTMNEERFFERVRASNAVIGDEHFVPDLAFQAQQLAKRKFGKELSLAVPRMEAPRASSSNPAYNLEGA